MGGPDLSCFTRFPLDFFFPWSLWLRRDLAVLARVAAPTEVLTSFLSTSKQFPKPRQLSQQDRTAGGHSWTLAVTGGVLCLVAALFDGSQWRCSCCCFSGCVGRCCWSQPYPVYDLSFQYLKHILKHFDTIQNSIPILQPSDQSSNHCKHFVNLVLGLQPGGDVTRQHATVKGTHVVHGFTTSQRAFAQNQRRFQSAGVSLVKHWVCKTNTFHHSKWNFQSAFC